MYENCLELLTSCLDIWDVGEGFPYEAGEVGGDEQMGNFGVECGSGEECCVPVCVCVM